MKIVPIIIPKINEINYTIVPPSRDGGKSVGTQIRDLRDVYNRGGDTITVEDDAVFEDTEYMTEDTSGTNLWLDIFDELAGPKGGTVGVIKNRPYKLSQSVPITADVFEILTKKFLEHPEIYQNMQWLDRAHRVLKNAGVGKVVTDEDDYIEYYRKGGIERDERTLLAFRNFVNTIRSKEGSIEDPVGKLKAIINSYDNLVSGEGNAQQKEKGGGSTAKRTGILDITKDIDFRRNEINNFIVNEIKNLEKGNPENPSVTVRIKELIGAYRVTKQSVRMKASEHEKKVIDLKRRYDAETDPRQKYLIGLDLKGLEHQGVSTPENAEGNDLADANLLLTYSVLIGNEEMIKSIFEDLQGSEVDFSQQERINGRFSKSLIKRLLDIATMKGYNNIVIQLKGYANLGESFIPKKLIMTERQAKLLSMLKEDNISENLATDITKKELGYRCPTDHRKIKNIDKTDYAKKLKDERESRTNVAANVTKNAKTFGYKTPTNRKRSLSVHKNDDINDKEIINSYFAKEKKTKKTESNTLTKKEIIESILKNLK